MMMTQCIPTVWIQPVVKMLSAAVKVLSVWNQPVVKVLPVVLNPVRVTR